MQLCPVFTDLVTYMYYMYVNEPSEYYPVTTPSVYVQFLTELNGSCDLKSSMLYKSTDKGVVTTTLPMETLANQYQNLALTT